MEPAVPCVEDDFHIMGTIVRPHKTDTPLVVNANAVLSRPVATKKRGRGSAVERLN
jgi:hypothetical protein